MPFAKCIFSLSIAFGPLIPMAHAEMQEQAPPMKLAQSTKDAAPAATKAKVAEQIQQLNNEYNAIKLKTAKYLPLTPSTPPPLKQARAEMSASMATAEGLLNDSKNKLGSDPESKIQEIEKKIGQLEETLTKLVALDKKIADLQVELMRNVGSDHPSSSPNPPRRKP